MSSAESQRSKTIAKVFTAGLITAAISSVAWAAGADFHLRVGAAAVPLEADDSMVIAGGIGPGSAKGQEGQLRAVAVVVQGPDGNKVAIVACDVLFTPADIVDPALEEIERTTGVPTGQAVTRMKQAVLDALEKAKPQSVTRVRSQKSRFAFKVRTFDESAEDDKVDRYVRKYARTMADKTIDIFREMRRELKPKQHQERETVIQVVLIGDVAIAGVPAEYFTSLGMDIKQRSPFQHTYIAELANDWIGYLPDRQAHRLGGYQTWMGLHSYAEVGTGERMADAVVHMLRELAM
jgi:hypothetical protein